jgi:pimeloyl-ACP methyl ester carboxylesterase
MGKIAIDSQTIYFQDARPKGVEPMATILFIHGAGGSSQSWRLQYESLSESFRVIGVDLPGHGMTGGPGEETIADFANNITSLMDALGLESTVLGGHSMGGAIALDIALRSPDRVAGLVLVGTGARLRVMPMIFPMLKDDFAGALDQMGSTFFGSGVSEELMNEEKQLLAKNSPDVMIRDFKACDSFDVMEEVSSISKPTLVVCGDHDMLSPPKYAAFMSEKIEGSEYVLFEGCGHMPMLEKSEEFNKVVASFLARLK